MAYSLVRSRHINGQLVFYDSEYLQRWVDAIGPNAIKYLNDFNSEQGTACEGWTETASGTSGVLSYDEDGGVLFLYTAGDDGDSIQIQKLGGYRAGVNDPLYFGVRWKITGTTGAGSCGIAMGLCIEDTAVHGPAGVSDGIYFYSGSAETTIQLRTELNSTAGTSTAGTIAVDTYYIDEFYFNGAATTGATTVQHWHDGTYIGAISSSTICGDEALGITIGFMNDAAHPSATTGLCVDWVRAIQLLGSR